jgi:hypothetical protein
MCLIETIYHANHTADSKLESMYPDIQTRDDQIPFNRFMYSPIVPRLIQDGRVTRWKRLVLPRSVTFDEAILSNHLTYGEQFVENHR